LASIGTLRCNGVYASTKRAIEALTDSLRLEMLAFDVSVTSVIPGYVNTQISDKHYTSYTGIIPEETYKPYESLIETLLRSKIEKNNHKDAPGPEVTTEAIIHALTDPYPYTRYYVGSAGDIPVKVVPYLALLPDRVGDLLKINRI